MKVLLATLLLTGVSCRRDTTFVYSTVRGDVLMPCAAAVLLPDCSSISWTFYKGGDTWSKDELFRGPVKDDPDKSRRMSIMANCSLCLRDLKANDAGAYYCVQNETIVADIYLSLLTITSTSSVTDLQPGGTLVLSCILFTYYDAGSCGSFSHRVFNLSWVAEDEQRLLSHDSRLDLIHHSRCNITLIIELRREDHDRKWKCQVHTADNHVAYFLDFTSAFLLNPPTSRENPSVAVQLPISRIMLCAALSVILMIVGCSTWRGGRRRS